MKRILGLDLGTASIGWALVYEAENESERSSIIRLGVRVIPSTKDLENFEKGKSIETNAKRRERRSARRNLQRYKLRREALTRLLIENGFITDETILSEHGNRTTFETYHLRAKAVTEEIKLEELARVLLMINKKRGYKSSRKAKGDEDGKLIDGMEVAMRLYEEGITPGALCFELLASGKKNLPEFYRSDLQGELDRVWQFQRQFYPDSMTEEARGEITGKNKSQTWAILAKHFIWKETVTEWDSENACSRTMEKENKLTGMKRAVKGQDLKLENYKWRKQALVEKMNPEELAIVIQEINGEINSSSGYLGAISDRSKSLYFNHLTVGQAMMKALDANPHTSLKNMVYYRQDYLDEFEAIWEKQAEFHKELTDELKHKMRDIVIFYQRRLKSQKSLISICEFERRDKKMTTKDGKAKTVVVGSRVIPRSSPLFQEFKIWQTLNNVEVSSKDNKRQKRYLTQEEKEILAEELSIRESLKKTDVLKLLFDKPSELDLNFKAIDGNRTGHQLFNAFRTVLELSGHEPLDVKRPACEIKGQVREVFGSLGWNTKVLDFDSSLPLDEQDYFRLWHLLYSFEGDNTVTGYGNLVDGISNLCNMDRDYAKAIASVSFLDDYGSLSAKAIRKILPFLKEGCQYDVACGYAGYHHSAASLTKEEIENKELKESMKLLSKNSLRNPVVEKILNQMVNVVNGIIRTYGRPDEIRVELARELKKNQKEREELSKAINSATNEQNAIREVLMKEFGIAHPTRTYITRYRLYEELKPNGYRTVYSNTYIPKEKLFSNEFDIEHIIPKARLFDDSFSNKTIEAKSINIEKGKKTAYDFVAEKYGEQGLEEYLNRCKDVFSDKKTKLKKLKMQESEIPDGFIERDLRNTQYIAKRALAMLGEVCRRVVATTGSITDQLRNDWQLVDTMKELNWDKYNALGLVEYHQDRNGRQIGKIKDWTKRNDHRHHAMDALTVAFTKDVFIQYYNNKNASDNPNTNEYAIKMKYFSDGKAISPIPLSVFRSEAKRHMEEILVSIKAKNKIVTNNINKTKSKQKGKGGNSIMQQTPRGQLHNETIYGSHIEYDVKEEKVNAAFDEAKIMTVRRKAYRDALLCRLRQFGGDAKKAFTGKNTLEKNPIWLDDNHAKAVPIKVETATPETVYTNRKPIDKELNINKVVDKRIKTLLQNRLEEYGGNAEKAFANLDENPIWVNEEKGISLKRVKIKEKINVQAIHEKKDKDGHFILDRNGNRQPVDFVDTNGNHHVAIYRKPVLDKKGMQKLDEEGNPVYELDERVVSFYEAVARVNQGLPAVDKEYNSGEGWKFLFTMKQNEYFVFPNEATGFDPKEIDLMDPKNYKIISPNLFRVQKFTSKDYVFRHHLETNVENNKELQNIAWKRITSFAIMDGIVKVRVNHIGQIVAVGEY